MCLCVCVWCARRRRAPPPTRRPPTRPGRPPAGGGAVHSRAKAAAAHMRQAVAGHSQRAPDLSYSNMAQLQIIFCPFCEQPQACSSSKEGFKSAGLNCNTAYSHMKTCSRRAGRCRVA